MQQNHRLNDLKKAKTVLFREEKTAYPENALEADTGYQELAGLHANSVLPKKRSRKHPLTKQERKENRAISSQRILVEHAIRFVKRFRILSGCYR